MIKTGFFFSFIVAGSHTMQPSLFISFVPTSFRKMKRWIIIALLAFFVKKAVYQDSIRNRGLFVREIPVIKSIYYNLVLLPTGNEKIVIDHGLGKSTPAYLHTLCLFVYNLLQNFTRTFNNMNPIVLKKSR